MVYDAECDFCVTWITRWRRVTGDRVEYAPLQRVASEHPAIPLERFRAAVHLLEPGGRWSSGAEAVFRSLATVPGRRFWLALYLRSPLFARASESAYRFVARNRGALGRFLRVRRGA